MFVVMFRARTRSLDPEFSKMAGRERWYDSHSVQVASVTREYHG